MYIKSIVRRRDSLDIPSQEPSDSFEVSPEAAQMSRRYPQLKALLSGGGSWAVLASPLVTWAFTPLSGWAAVLLTLSAVAIHLFTLVIPLVPLTALVWVGLSTHSTERRESAEKYFERLLPFLERYFGR